MTERIQSPTGEWLRVVSTINFRKWVASETDRNQAAGHGSARTIHRPVISDMRKKPVSSMGKSLVVRPKERAAKCV
jgi:hypothetical protein